MPGVERTETRIVGFQSPEMDFQLMRQLGAASYGGGAPGEIFAARARISGEDPYQWPAAFGALGAETEAAGTAALARGHDASAVAHLMRATSYFRSAEYFSDPFGTEAHGYGTKSRETFLRAAGRLPHRVEPVDIPYEGGPLPGYFMTPAGGARGDITLILMTGFDGTGEELYFHAGAEGLARGFNVFIAEGPGQVGTLRRDPKLVFRPDYEVPIGAIVDFALSRPEVRAERLGLYGISFGGYFAARGASRDKRIGALIANSPIIDLLAYMSAFVGADAAKDGEDYDVRLDEVDAVPDEYMPHAVKLSFKSACRRFGVTSLSGWFRALAAYRVTDELPAIACPSLAMVGTGEGGEALRQADAFCAAVSGPSTRRDFTVGEGADMHCQLGNLPLSNAVVYDWLAETLGGR